MLRAWPTARVSSEPLYAMDRTLLGVHSNLLRIRLATMKRAVLKDLTLLVLVAGALEGLLGTLLLQHKR